MEGLAWGNGVCAVGENPKFFLSNDGRILRIWGTGVRGISRGGRSDGFGDVGGLCAWNWDVAPVWRDKLPVGGLAAREDGEFVQYIPLSSDLLFH